MFFLLSLEKRGTGLTTEFVHGVKGGSTGGFCMVQVPEKV